MVFVYHRVPKEMKGSVLYPLHELKEKFPQIYRSEIEKYKDREGVLRKSVPLLNCLWNDVLHFTPVHPLKIKKALEDVGFSPGTFRYYKIKASDLDSDLAVLYHYRSDRRGVEIPADEVQHFEPSDLLAYKNLPEKTKEYYAASLKKGERPLLFHLVPHVLFRGNLSVRGLPVIEV